MVSSETHYESPHHHIAIRASESDRVTFFFRRRLASATAKLRARHMRESASWQLQSLPDRPSPPWLFSISWSSHRFGLQENSEYYFNSFNAAFEHNALSQRVLNPSSPSLKSSLRFDCLVDEAVSDWKYPATKTNSFFSKLTSSKLSTQLSICSLVNMYMGG